MNKLMFFSLTGESVLWRHADIDACTSSESCGKTTSFAGMKKVREATPAGPHQEEKAWPAASDVKSWKIIPKLNQGMLPFVLRQT